MLTPRQLEVLRLGAGGLTYQQAATRLEIRGGTMSTHWRHIREQLGAKTNLHAVAIGFNTGLLTEGKTMAQTPCESGACVRVDEYVDEVNGTSYIRVRSGITGTAMQCTPQEWAGFLADLGDGRWAHIGARELAKP